MKRHKEKSEINIGEAAAVMVKANIMAYVVTAIFILFGSIILTYTHVSANFESVIVMLGVMVSAFLAGFDTAKIESHNGYKWGAIGGLCYFMIFLVLGTLINKLTNVSPSMLFLTAVMVLITSTVAGMISVNCHTSGNRRR